MSTMKKKEVSSIVIWFGNLTVLLQLILILTPFVDSSYRFLSFPQPVFDTPKFNHMAVDSVTGRVYVGAVNKLYQLKPNLEMEMSETTGPHADSPDCPPSQECSASNINLTDNVNKILVIDNSARRLITCGSLFHGLCSVHNMLEISDSELIANIPVSANNAEGTTVAFVAPGPPNPPATDVLYVGTSYTTNGTYRSQVPSVSSRSLLPNNMLSFASSSEITGTRLFVNSLSRERYPINFVYGFSSGGFSYFLTTQKQSIDTPYPFVSKIIRVCHKDRHYYSYTEIPIECKSEDVNYNLVQSAFIGKSGSFLANDLGVTPQDDVLYAVFAKSKNNSGSYDKGTAPSAFCFYSLHAIQRKFKQNIQHCFNGNGDLGLGFIVPSVKCARTQMNISEDFCGEDVNTPLGGSMPVVAHPVYTHDSKVLTAVAATPVHDHTVAFLGTSHGHLIKVRLESSTINAYGYNEIDVDEFSPVNPDLLFDPNKEHIYVMTERKVTRMKLSECHFRTHCDNCLQALDPFCGWCSFHYKCSTRSECGKESFNWRSSHNGTCSMIASVNPRHIQKTMARNLEIIIYKMASVPDQLECVFTSFNNPLRTNAIRTAEGVKCPTPHIDELPPIPPGKHDFTATLTVESVNGSALVGTNFTFFDCGSYTSCTECVSSPFPCDWCVASNRCTHDTNENCRNDILVTGINRIGPSIRSGPAFCPRFQLQQYGESGELLVSYGQRSKITIKVENIGMLTVSTRFACQFDIEGSMTEVQAQILGDTVYCESMEFKYISNSSIVNASLAVLWDGDKRIDNSEHAHVRVYHCPYLASNCGQCSLLPNKYNCIWCQTSNKCVISSTCESKETVTRHETCPNPRIDDFSPKNGLLQNGTRLTIHGINLGKTFDDIKDGVRVAGVKCNPISSGYIPTTQIVCDITTPQQPTADLSAGNVVVYVENNLRAESGTAFVFVNPIIENIYPTHGPQSGGTKLNITGHHLNAASNIEAFIGILPCKITRTTMYWAECVTTKSVYTLRSGILRMKFDGGERRITEDVSFNYVADPTITSVQSIYPDQKYVIKVIPSGGITLKVRGMGLDAVQDPKVYISYQNKEYFGHCTIETPTVMKCSSPAIPVKEPIATDDPREVQLGFVMDNVLKYRSYPAWIYPEPKYMEFDEENKVKLYKSDYLTINGENLDRACTEEDVVVEIGASHCQITSLSRSQLTCRPPTTQPFGRSDNGSPDANSLPGVVACTDKATLRFYHTVVEISNVRLSLGFIAKPRHSGHYATSVLSTFGDIRMHTGFVSPKVIVGGNLIFKIGYLSYRYENMSTTPSTA